MRLREFAARNRLPHGWIELEEDPKAEALLERFGGRRVIVYNDPSRFVRSTSDRLSPTRASSA